MNLDERERKLRERLEKLDAMEAEIRAREKAVKAARNERKQIILRLPQSLWDEIAAWA